MFHYHRKRIITVDWTIVELVFKKSNQTESSKSAISNNRLKKKPGMNANSAYSDFNASLGIFHTSSTNYVDDR